MIFLFTGVPGAGKTLNALKFVNEDAQFKDRPVFYYNIRELTLEGWQELSGDKPKGDEPLDSDRTSVFQWYDLPHGSVVFVDECQAVFPPRNVRQEAPPHISELNVHRHKGIDLVLVTQHPRLIDTSVKPLVGQHQHYERKYGWPRVKRVTFEKCQDNTDAKSAREMAQIKNNIPFDKKYFNVYKSAEVHTHKSRIPTKLVMIFLFLFALLPTYMYFAYDNVLGKVDQAKGIQPEDAQLGDKLDPQNFGSAKRIPQKTASDIAAFPVDQEEYLKLYKPRIDHLPNTAPIYDELMQPVTAPKTLCTSWRDKKGVDRCQCYTQQITQVSMPFQACKNIVNNRLWDPTLPDRSNGEVRATGQRSSPLPPAASDPVSEPISTEQTDNGSFTIIGNPAHPEPPEPASLVDRIYPDDLPPMKVSFVGTDQS